MSHQYPALITTIGGNTSNSYVTRAEADEYMASTLYPGSWPANESASATIGTTGTVTTTVDEHGTEGNLWTIEAVLGGAPNTPLSAAVVGTAITITLATDGAGAAHATANSALLVAAVIDALADVSATAGGTTSAQIPVTPTTAFTGGTYHEEIKNVALIMATRLLDAKYDWAGNQTTLIDEPSVGLGQRLAWPRSGVIDADGLGTIDDDVLPRQLKEATAELAKQLIASDTTVNSQAESQGLTSLSVGSISLSFRDGFKASDYTIPDYVISLMPPWWGSIRGRGLTWTVLRG